MLSYGNPVQGLPEVNVTTAEICPRREIQCADNNTMQFSVSSLLRLGQKSRHHSDIESNEGIYSVCVELVSIRNL